MPDQAAMSTPDTLTPIHGLPRPENLPQLLGYPRRNKRVAFFWELNELVWKDSQASSNTADWYAWKLYTEDPRILPFFAPFDWYSEEGPGPSFLLIDNESRHVSVGPIEDVDKALGKPPPFDGPVNVIDQDDLDYLLRHLARSAPEVVDSVQARQAERQAELKRWLNRLEQAAH